MRSRIHAAWLAVGLVTLMSGCSRQDAAADAEREAAAEVASAPAAAPMPAGAPSAGAAPDTPPDTQAQLESAVVAPSGDRRFVRTANVEFRVEDVYRSALAIEDLAVQQGGFVASNAITSEVDRVETRPNGDGRVVELATYTVRGKLQVRVPSERAQAFLRALASHVEFLDRRTFEASDAQFDLLRQRLAQDRHQQAQRSLRDASAGDGKVGEKVDAIEARASAQAQRDEAAIARATLEDRIAFATIDLSLYQSPQVRRTERVDVDAVVRDNGPGFFARLGHALREGWHGGLALIVALAYLWPLWLGVALALVGLRAWRRYRH